MAFPSGGGHTAFSFQWYWGPGCTLFLNSPPDREVPLEVFAFVLVIYLFVRLAFTPSQVEDLEHAVGELQRLSQRSASAVPARRRQPRRRIAGERRRTT